ncbi:glycerol kinase GlpK [bacterium]|nr:glycerol kinase GlpK [bacterium]
MKYILALDQGTTSSRAILFDRKGSIRAQAQKEFRQIYPRPGWVEQRPVDIWQSQLQVAKQALKQASANARDIAAIGITNQRETTLVWDRQTGAPIGNAIVWQDRRTSDFCDQLKHEKLSSIVQRKTGLIIDAYFSATKLHWILKNVKGALARARAGRLAFGTVDTWLIWNLTQGRTHVTDVTNAARTMLFNIHDLEWDEHLLKLFGIPREMLPEVGPTSGVLAETNLFGGTIPIAGVAGDQQAALFGQSCFEPGMAKNTYGTGCFLVLNTGNKPVRSKNKLLTTIAWKIGDRVEYALEGSIFVAGAVTQWLRDGLGVIRDSTEIERLAKSVSDNGGVYFVPAFAGLGAPHWDQHARGLIKGLTRGTTAGHLARAALEGIAYQVHDVVRAMEADSGHKLKQLRVDGGASVNNLLMQFQADVLGTLVVRPKVVESTARGAALLAGLAVGFWPDQATLAKQWEADQTFRPKMKATDRSQMLDGWNRALKQAMTG